VQKVENLPGLVGALSGGTRTKIKLDRPWQTEIAIDPASCPFETLPQTEVARFEDEGV
jgi:hypothetical protein